MILETLVQLPFVCMDGLTLFFMAMLKPARQGGRVLCSLSTGIVLNYPAHQLFDVWTSHNHKNGQRRGKYVKPNIVPNYPPFTVSSVGM